MPLFQYQAISEDGKKIAASIDAESLQDAKQKLIRRQIVAIKISPLSEKEMKKISFEKRGPFADSRTLPSHPGWTPLVRGALCPRGKISRTKTS